jgi:hypothetical protein
MRAPAHRNLGAPLNFLNTRFCGWEEKQLTANDSNKLALRCHPSFVLDLDKQLSTRLDVRLLVDKGGPSAHAGYQSFGGAEVKALGGRGGIAEGGPLR